MFNVHEAYFVHALSRVIKLPEYDFYILSLIKNIYF